MRRARVPPTRCFRRRNLARERMPSAKSLVRLRVSLENRMRERVGKPGSVVERSFISNVRRRTPQARNPNARKGSRVALLFALAPDGVFQATPLPTCWCALTAPFQLFPCSPRAVGEFSFLWHFPSGRPAQPLAGILPLGARTFLAPKHAIAWPARGMVFYHIGWIG